MNTEQKRDFLKRLAQGKTNIQEIIEVNPFDISVPLLVWAETEKNIYSNVSGMYFDKKGIKPGELSLTFTEFQDYIKRIGSYRMLIYGKPLSPGEIDPHEGDKKRWITFK